MPAPQIRGEMLDAAGLEVLGRDECIRLLAKVPVGRIVFTVNGLPAIQPVNFLLHENALIVRTSTGSRLATAADDAVVAFEVDDFENGDVRAGWSVVVVGRAHPITDRDELDAARQLPLQPWAPGNREHYIRISLEMVTGRRIKHEPPRRT